MSQTYTIATMNNINACADADVIKWKKALAEKVMPVIHHCATEGGPVNFSNATGVFDESGHAVVTLTIEDENATDAQAVADALNALETCLNMLVECHIEDVGWFLQTEWNETNV